MPEGVIVEAVRTAVGRRNGKLKDVHPAVLGSLVLKELVSRAGIDAAQVRDVVFGCVTQLGEQGTNIGRNAWLTAGFPVATPATTVDRPCGSSHQAIHFAANLIAAGVSDITIAGGVESMTRGADWLELRRLRDLLPARAQRALRPRAVRHFGRADGALVRDLAGEDGRVRCADHQRAHEATEKGCLRSQILPVEMGANGHTDVFDRDEGVRANASYEAAAALQPAFDPTHSITAANSSQISDGAAAVLLMSADKARGLGLRPRARIAGQAVVGTDPVLMLVGPIPGTKAVLENAGLALRDIDLFEVNEAFASVVLAWAKETGADLKRTNVNGGAIAIGHPLGVSGARLMCHLLYELQRRDLRYGLETMCCGGGIGTATVIDRRVA